MSSIRRPLVASILAIVAIAISTPCSFAAEPATAEGAAAFVESAEARILKLIIELGRAQWVQATYINDDTESLVAAAHERFIAATVELAEAATRFDDVDLPYDVRRKLGLIKLMLTLPAPNNGAERSELTRIAAGLEGAYGKGKYCPEEGDCLTLGDLSRTLATSRDADELLEAWTGWRTVGPAMRADYERFAELGNKGARELGFDDLGAMWRSKYDMDPDDFATEMDRQWDRVRPLYDSLHCYVRRRLGETYGEDVVPANGPILAHLLGNMWAQGWGNIYDLVAPADGDRGFDLTQQLEQLEVDEREMVRYGERFFTSLGFDPLPDTFWERSQFSKPADREVVCHASAWDLDMVDDVRIKMCIETTAEDFDTVHHELGHNFYQRAYSVQSPLYRESANDGFHEGVGDTIALSVTPKYLVDVGLLDAEPEASKDIGVLLYRALDKVAFLPFGLLVDKWRWGVFSGDITPDEYNAAWWKLRLDYQGVVPPIERDESSFDPGAKYHVPANTPYARYFLAHILQFQFHRSLCELAGYDGPLHRCSIYGSEAAGDRLQEMLAMGQSRPWPDALEAISGQREMDATAILEYFAPLKSWLDHQNEGQSCGW